MSLLGSAVKRSGLKGVADATMRVMRFQVAEVEIEPAAGHGWQIADQKGPIANHLPPQTHWSSWVELANALGEHGWQVLDRSYVLTTQDSEPLVRVLFTRTTPEESGPIAFTKFMGETSAVP
jgi:hypothetical protein